MCLRCSTHCCDPEIWTLKQLRFVYRNLKRKRNRLKNQIQFSLDVSIHNVQRLWEQARRKTRQYRRNSDFLGQIRKHLEWPVKSNLPHPSYNVPRSIKFEINKQFSFLQGSRLFWKATTIVGKPHNCHCLLLKFYKSGWSTCCGWTSSFLLPLARIIT